MAIDSQELEVAIQTLESIYQNINTASPDLMTSNCMTVGLWLSAEMVTMRKAIDAIEKVAHGFGN